MISFQVDDMTCGHCVSSITKAVKALDSSAEVQINLAAHRVEIEPSTANAVELGEAIKEAGYTPVAIGNSSTTPIVASATTRSGCSCG
jgi:copper chaperone